MQRNWWKGLALVLSIVVLHVGSGFAVTISVTEQVTVSPNASYTLTPTIKHNGSEKTVLVYPQFTHANMTVIPNASQVSVTADDAAYPSFTFHTPPTKGIISVHMVAQHQNGTTSQRTVFRISSTTAQLRKLINYYENLLVRMQQRLPQKQFVDLERAVNTADELYSKERYDAVTSQLEKIRQEVNQLDKTVSTNVTNLTAREAAPSTERTSSFMSPWMFIGVGALFIVIIALLVVGKTVMARTADAKDNETSLSDIKSSLKDSGATDMADKLDTLIADVNERIDTLKHKGLDTEELERELALVRRKQQNGLQRMAMQYLSELEQKVKEQETHLYNEVNARG